MPTSRTCGTLGGIALAGALIACHGAPASATTITVTNDQLAGIGSLSKAIFDAQAGDTIDFALAYPAVIRFNFGLIINKNVTIVGPGSDNLTLDGNFDNTFFMMEIPVAQTVSVSNLTISHAAALAILNKGTLALENVIVSNNNGCLNNIGTLTVTDSVFSHNDGPNFGGALVNHGHATVDRSNFVINAAGIGGAAVFTDTGATLEVNDSAFVSNTGGFDPNTGRGGAILNFGTTTVNNSSFSGNVAGSLGDGGAIENTGTLTVDSSTFSGNVAESASALNNLGTATVRRTIIVGNCEGTVTSAGDNIASEDSCFADSVVLNDRRNLDPHVGVIGEYGGPTVSIPLLQGSPAIDAVIVNAAGCSGTDQRGVGRPLGLRCDIGAFELDTDPIFADGFD